MFKITTFGFSFLALLGFISLQGSFVSGQPGAQDKKFEDFDTLVKGAKEYEGLFRLHHKDDKLFAEIRQDQLEKSFLLPIAVARGAGWGGHTLNFGEQWVVFFHRVGDRVYLVRRNVRFTARPGTPSAKAVETTYTDSVLLSLKIYSINPARQSLLINFNEIFMSDFAQLGFGTFDPSRSSWHKVKGFSRNVELEVAATYSSSRGGRGFHGGNDSVIDSRGETVIIHYGLAMMPDPGFQPRLADDRVGHFLTAVKDFSSDSQDTSFRRFVNRWRLERVDPVDPKNPNKLSPPRKKIVFWIEKSVPDEYRASVREGILEWNQAFEKIGFRDAIEVRQQENEDFDPEDINYNTFRWITSDQGYAMGPSRANPLTGEILDADIIFDASMVRFWRQEAAALGQQKEAISLIQAAKLGTNLGQGIQFPGLDLPRTAGWDTLPQKQQQRQQAMEMAGRYGLCQCANHMKRELGLASLVALDRGLLKAGEKIPEELINQAIKEVTMHEVGHTLGLRHNFKASTFLKNDQLHDTAITRKQGLVGSVMDYAPVNLAPKGKKQGDYYTTTIGPYDYWAIEYAYRPLAGGTDGEVEKLNEIARLAPKPGMDYATDEDYIGGYDPLVNTWDLGADPMEFAKERILLAKGLLSTLAENAVDTGEGYQRTRDAFRILMGQYADGAFLTASFVGGEYMHRDHKGDPGGRDPFIPVTGAKQREALRFLKENLLADKAIPLPPELLRKLAADRWMHWGNDRIFRVQVPVLEMVLAVQSLPVEHLLDDATLARIQNNSLKAAANDQALKVAEVFSTLQEGIWGEVTAPGPANLNLSISRRNLQRVHLKTLTSLALDSSAVPDGRSLARMYLKSLGKAVQAVLENKAAQVEETTRAHLEECQERIQKVLAASILIRN
ncbi:MAG: DUF5117 domain-containing protein [Gemmataceae bacterium]|nr:DUF5117 domain-containing protein [Gemmataceae bacterium]